MTQVVKRGDIFSVNFEPVRGSEQGKVRPALIIQNDIGNTHSPLTIVAAITSGRNSRFRINVVISSPEGGLTNDSIVLLNEIRTVDKSRLGRYWGSVSQETMNKVDEAIQLSLGLIQV